jgi:osmotically-inducible protein OsmY
MKVFLCAATLALAFTGCKSDDKRKVEADNTAKNERNTKTADEAVNTSSDLELTQEIRKAVMADDSLGTNAQNAKIVVTSGDVTLVGPVASADEKAALERIASSKAGTRKVINQLEVTN